MSDICTIGFGKVLSDLDQVLPGLDQFSLLPECRPCRQLWRRSLGQRRRNRWSGRNSWWGFLRRENTHCSPNCCNYRRHSSAAGPDKARQGQTRPDKTKVRQQRDRTRTHLRKTPNNRLIAGFKQVLNRFGQVFLWPFAAGHPLRGCVHLVRCIFEQRHWTTSETCLWSETNQSQIQCLIKIHLRWREGTDLVTKNKPWDSSDELSQKHQGQEQRVLQGQRSMVRTQIVKCRCLWLSELFHRLRTKSGLNRSTQGLTVRSIQQRPLQVAQQPNSASRTIPAPVPDRTNGAEDGALEIKAEYGPSIRIHQRPTESRMIPETWGKTVRSRTKPGLDSFKVTLNFIFSERWCWVGASCLVTWRGVKWTQRVTGLFQRVRV